MMLTFRDLEAAAIIMHIVLLTLSPPQLTLV